jgi:hypothetical protein
MRVQRREGGLTMDSNAIGKIAGGIVASLIATGLVAIIGEFVGLTLFPSDAEYVVYLPRGAKAVIVLTWGAAAFAGALAARLLGERGWLAPVGAVWTLIGVVLSLRSEPYPLTMAVTGIAAPLLAAAAVMIGMRKR